MTNPLDKILRPVKDKIVRAASGSNVSQDAMNLALMNQRMGKGLISDKVNLINYNSNIASELGIKARSDQQRAIEAEGLRQEAAKKVQPTVGYRESTTTKPDPLEGRRYVVSKPTKIITPPMFDPSKHRLANTSVLDWDSTNRNVDVTGVSGHNDMPIFIRTPGGKDYTFDVDHIAKEIGGASGKGISERIVNRINTSSKEGLEKGGTGEALSFVQTMGDGGENFSHPIPQFLFDVVNHRLMEGRITPADANYITKLVQTRSPERFGDTSEFAGFNDKGWDQFHTGKNISGTTAGDLRRAISDVADLDGVQRLLDFNMADLRGAIIDDKLKGVPRGYIGSAVIQAPKGGSVTSKNPLYPDESPYDTNFSGKGIAQFPAMMNTEALFYRVMNPIKEELLARPNKIPYTANVLHNSALAAIAKRKDNFSQIIDPRFEDDYGNYFNELSRPNEYKEGGEVPHMMGGGGAKSKNAPKFTEAITQGLGPMLYGAARGTAAGLAGIGGDIEELARLGINYAGDKLQGRFPNMLDKRDVVGAKATLPTSERVLSKIPSLKDFGAGPEARHSEDIAAKLGMYGLSNIAAPKVGKAVVQGVNATGKALAPKAGEMLENYMVRTGGILPMDVWHGSPHRFPPTAKNPLGEFDASKIGTGEGAQAYGHGHYSAEVRDLAKTYQPRSPLHEEKLIKEYNRAQVKSNYPKMEVLEDAMLHKSPDEILAKFSNIEDGYTPEHAKAANEYLLWLGKNQPEVGSLYKVDLPDAQIAKMLDWDKAVEGDIASRLVRSVENTKGMNPDDFKDALGLSRMYEGQPESGSSIYRLIAGSLGSDAKASKWLKESDIPGIRYLDQGSRDAGEGTRNFVVFPGNEEMLNILSREKDGGLVHGKKNGGAIHMAKGSDKEDFEVTLKRLGLGSTKPLPGLSLDTKLPLPSTPSVLRVGSERKPNYYSYQDRSDAAGSTLYPFPEEMEAAKRPATVNPLMQRQALRRSPETPQKPIEPEEQTYTDSDRSFTPSPSPTFRQNSAEYIQRALEAMGSSKPRARSFSQGVMGVGGTGFADFVPFLGAGLAWDEGARNIQEANRKGDTVAALGEAGLMSAQAALGAVPAIAILNHLAGKIKSPLVRMSKADFNRIARENEPKQLSAPELQRLLNAPPEKTIYEMQQELAQQRASKPDLMAEEYANGGEVTSDDLILIERRS